MARSYTNTRAPSNLVSNRFLRKLPLGHLLVRARNTRYALINRKLILGGTVPISLDVLVVSPGGSGSTELMEHISKFFVCNSPIDRDGLKHLPAPPPTAIARKIIFVYRDLEQIKRSFTRRRSVTLQLLKLRPQGLFIGSKNFWNLEFVIEKQRRSFAEQSEIETLFVHYSELFESAQKISDFLGHRGGFVEGFPKRSASLSKT